MEMVTAEREHFSVVSALERIREGLLENAAARMALEVAMLAWPRLNP